MLRAVAQSRAQSEYQLAIKYAQKILAIDIADELAHQHLMFCYITLGDRNKALGQYETCQRALRDELAVEPTPETQALYHWIRQSVSEIPSLAAQVTNLPIPISSFVGRTRELSKIKQLLSNTRLVTLTGAGGSGKTRLAIHAATDLIDSFKDGVWWVELAPLTEPSLVPSAVAKALGISGRADHPLTETLKQYLRNKKLLLVLDNCEHLIDTCAHLAESLLTSCVDLKIMTTSREALCLSGENVWLVPPLSLPETRSITLLDLLMEYEGVRLFIERASAINPQFMPSDENAIAITQICQHLDGIPLAIELVAARIRNMSVEQISAGLEDRFQLLTASTRTANLRHQTLHAAIDWSYNLLSEAERLLFCRLSVFSGGWTREAAEVICSGEGIEKKDISDLLGHLVDKSILTISADGQRYGILETIRQYAREKLIETGLEDLVIQKHLDHFLSLAETADEKIRGPEQLAWLEWLDAEHDNLTAAIKRSLANPAWVDVGGRLVCALCWYWGLVGDFIQMRRWLESAFHQSACLGRKATRAKILFNAGAFSVIGLSWFEPVEASALVQESLEIWRELGSEYTLEAAQSLLFLGFIQKRGLDNDAGVDYMLESIDTFKYLGNSWWQAWALNLYKIFAWDSNNDYQSCRSMLEAEADLWKEAGDTHGKANILWDLGQLELANGKFVESVGHLEKSLDIFISFKSKGYIQQVIKCLGDATRALKKYERAQKYYEESLQLARFIGWEDLLISDVYHGLGYPSLHMGNDQAAEDYFLHAVKIDRENDDKALLALSLLNFASLAVFRKDPITAARLFGAFHANIEPLQAELRLNEKIIYLIDQLETDQYLAHCRAQVNESVFDQAWNAGCQLTLDEAIDEILQTREEMVISEP